MKPSPQETMQPVTRLENLPDLQHGQAVQLALDINGKILHIKQVIRLLPGKRLVASAELEGSLVLAKLFFAKGPSRAIDNEQQGYQLLQQAGIPTPECLLHTRLGENTELFIYQFIDQACGFYHWYQSAAAEARATGLGQLFALLEKLYQQGLYQQDIHLDNFLCAEPNNSLSLLLLDPGSVKRISGETEKASNLASLVAQFNLFDQDTVLRHLNQVKPAGVCITEDQLEKAWDIRTKIFTRKLFRDCTDIKDLSGKGFNVYARREVISPELITLIESIRAEKIIPASQLDKILKQGNSSVVSKVNCGNRQLVVKYCRNKTWLKKLKRLLKTSRGRNSWYFAHLFRFSGLTVPEPVALLESRLGPFTTESWYISEYIEAPDLLSFWQEHPAEQKLVEKVLDVFRALKKLGVSHGDFKATNIIVYNNQTMLIDYDGVRGWAFKSMHQKALEKDRQRLLKNWSDPQISQQLDKPVMNIILEKDPQRIS